MTVPGWFLASLDAYVEAIRARRGVPDIGAEESLYPPLDRLLNDLLTHEGPRGAHAVPQPHTEYGIPDFVVYAGGPLGYVEAKQPTVDIRKLSGRDARQRSAYMNLPNVLYTNYRDFDLIVDGTVVGSTSVGDLTLLSFGSAGRVDSRRADELYALMRRFATHELIPPKNAAELARQLARATRVLFEAARTALRTAPDGALATLRDEWRHLLFDEASQEEFADAYAQTVSYGLLMAHVENPATSSIESALATLERRHEFLGAALRMLTHPKAVLEVHWAVELVMKIVANASPDLFRTRRHRDDPLLYFYEDFLTHYDADLRKRRGAYYTPASVVRFQVRALAELAHGLGRPRLLADDGVIALDPAVGTGTYLLGLLDETVARAAELGEGVIAAAASTAARQLNGFELLVGPYTVARQRVAARLRELGAGDAPVRIFLADTLAEADEARVGQLSLLEKPLAEEKALADEVKHTTPVMVIVGNPPYSRGKGRHDSDWLQRSMDWFTDPVPAEARVNLKNLADPYVHFYRWALWKLFHSDPGRGGPRLLSYISNRSFLAGDAFYGLRLRLRESFDDIWVIDVGGESRGAVTSENVFDVRVGVAILVGLRRDAAVSSNGSATVRYVRLEGTRAEKEAQLAGSLDDLEWTHLPQQGGGPLVPAQSAEWSSWVPLDVLMPTRQSGIQTKRDRLVVAPTRERLRAQLAAFANDNLSVDERRKIFHVTRDRDLPDPPRWDERQFRRVQYRPLDVRWLYDDPRYVDFPRPKLHALWHAGQRAFVTLPKGHGPGPAAFLAREIPDLHAFRGSFGGHVFPFWLDDAHEHPNLVRGVLLRLGAALGRSVAPDDVFAYVYGLLHAPGYTATFVSELETGFPRVPFTVDAEAFADVVSVGRSLLAAHAFEAPIRVRLSGVPGPLVEPAWSAGRLTVSVGAYIDGVSDATVSYSVSGYPVLRRWFAARQGLDLASDLTLVQDLLGVVSAIETSIASGKRLDSALARVLAGPILGSEALVPVTRPFPLGADERAAAAAELDADDVLSVEAWETST